MNVSVQNVTSLVTAGKKKCTNNVSVIIPESVDETLPDSVVITVDDDIAPIHTSAVHSSVDSRDEPVTPEVI